MVIKAEKSLGKDKMGWIHIGPQQRIGLTPGHILDNILKMPLLKTLPVFVSLKWPHTLCFNFCHLPSFRIVIVEVNRLVTEINQTKCKKDGRLVLKETLDPYPNKGNNDKQNI